MADPRTPTPKTSRQPKTQAKNVAIEAASEAASVREEALQVPVAPSVEPTLGEQPLWQLVTVRKRFQRSVHLERDFSLVASPSFAASQGAASTSNGAFSNDYHLTPSALEILKVIGGALEQPFERALSLVGPYGAGKSALCVFLARLLEAGATTPSGFAPHEFSPELAQLRARDEALYERLHDRLRGHDGAAIRGALIPILIVGSRQPLIQALVSGLVSSLQRGGARELADTVARRAKPCFRA